MSDIKRMLTEGNLRFHLKISQDLENIETKIKLPRYPVLILTCMDPRIDIHRIFQLDPGDVFVLRNAGNLCSQDSLRSILLAIYQYNIKYIIILGHLDCGMTKINLLELKRNVPYEFLPNTSNETLDLFAETRELFKPFNDELRNIKQQMETLHRLQLHNQEVKILGMLYDVETGWVLEYERFKEIISIENFRNHYKTILREKQYQFIDFLKTIEDEIVKKDEVRRLISETDSKNGETDQFLETVKIEKEELVELDVNVKTLRIGKIQNLNPLHQTLSIKIPKIQFSGVKIYIPKIIRWKKEI